MKPTPPETKAKAFYYYCLGLTSHEIAKLLDCSYRTIQNFMSAEKLERKKGTKKTPLYKRGLRHGDSLTDCPVKINKIFGSTSPITLINFLTANIKNFSISLAFLNVIQ